MEPNKREEDFRIKLNSRTLQPSETAWDRLDAMLSVAEEKKPKRRFTWLYIAAAFIGFVFVGLFLFDQQKNNVELNENTTTIVESNPVQEQPEASAPETVPEKLPVSVTPVKIKEAVAMTNTGKATGNPEIRVEKNMAKEKINEEMIAVVPQKSIQKNRVAVNVDELLAAVDGNQSKSELKKQNVTVDANSLLSTVEGELNTTYRENTFQTISRNFKTVKSAVANRNKE